MNEAAPPTSLPSITLEEVSESIVDGPFGSNLKTSDYVDSGVPVLQGKNITGNRFVWKEVRYISDEKARQLKRSSTVVGDHLLIKIGSIGYSAILDDLDGHDFAIIPANLARIRPDRSMVDDQYLHRVLTSDLVVRHFQKVASKTAQPALSLKKIKATEIPLPPLAEQKRIAGILDAADALRARRREALAQLDTLLQSTFLDMFGDPVTNPMGWEVKLLGEVTSIDAVMVDPTEHHYRNLLHYGPDRIEKNTGELLSAMTAEKDELVSGKFLCNPGEVLYSKIRPYLNKVALVKERCLCSADVYPVTPSPECMNKEYLWLLLRSDGFLDYVAGFSNRANIPKINRKQFAGYSAIVPPLDLQQRFASIVESVEQQKARMRTHLEELDTLFASLQSRAFNGEL